MLKKKTVRIAPFARNIGRSTLPAAARLRHEHDDERNN
jgi:hypothetical protein